MYYKVQNFLSIEKKTVQSQIQDRSGKNIQKTKLKMRLWIKEQENLQFHCKGKAVVNFAVKTYYYSFKVKHTI